MPTHFDLIISADSPNLTAEFYLRDAHGAQLAYRQTDFKDKNFTTSRLHGLFDLRNYLRLYVEEGKEVAAVAEIGVCVAEEVLGKEIFEKLWNPTSQRTLRIQLPGATEAENHLASALARVPWEIARPAASQVTLADRNLLVRVVHDMDKPASEPVDQTTGEGLRVLFVFAEAQGSRPLGARQERRELLRLFEREIYPERRVAAHFLTHGVTRERLADQIQQNGGYHVVHWSGHGHLNLLELAKAGGTSDRLSGEGLLQLFTDAGVSPPRLFFLSACHSGDILRVKDWNDFLAIAQGKEPGTKEAATKDLNIQEQPGFTGTAHALLQGGVPSVVAMRYAVGDDYARELAVEFYRALLAHAQPKDAAAALTLARRAMSDPKKHDAARFDACDHATPVLYGAEQPGIELSRGRSPELNPRNPRLHTINELTTAQHEHFVGRTWQLAELGKDFIGSSSGAEVKPVAVITGLGGMGKTALVAETLALWERRFERVLLYQAKPNALGFEGTLRDIHLKLFGELQLYHDHVRQNPADAIYRDGSADFTGAERVERLTRNLIRALKDEPILIVLDNFETNLKDKPEAAAVAGELAWACQDPAWESCLKALAQELTGSPSRVLITCRRPLLALADGACCVVRLGPLPPSEAALYLRAHPVLGRMVFGGVAAEQALAYRLLNASRFHPLLMDRLAKLAATDALRPNLLQALDTLEKTKDFAQLPALFATGHDDAKELAYLDDALAASLDQLIRDVSLDARRLLWIIAMANDPVALGLLKGVWSGESHKQEQLQQIKQMLAILPSLPPELQEKLQALPPELRAKLEALPDTPPTRPETAPLLRHLVNIGLATEERTGPEDGNPNITCHELVRERIRAWMAQQQYDQGELTENAIRLAYAERLAAYFKAMQHKNMTDALHAGSRAVVYCVQAEAWERLGGFASEIVTSTSDPRLLGELIPHLEIAVALAPHGNSRWSCLCYLADAWRLGGRPDKSLPFYEQAAALARAAAEAEGEGKGFKHAWSDFAWIAGNWANALINVGNLEASRQRQMDSAEASKKAGRSTVDVIGRELEALRIDIMQGKAEAALQEVEARLARVEQWWRRHRSGQPVPEAPNGETLARTFISALDVARQTDFAREDWASALRRLDAILEVERALKRPAENIGATQINRANVLRKLSRFGEAKAELENCLSLFQNEPNSMATVLGSLASLFKEQSDLVQAIIQQRRALALCEQLPDPVERAISHNNLANYLDSSGIPSNLAEAPRHQLAALLYNLVACLGQHLQTSLRNYAVDFRRAHAAGAELDLPRVAQLLADSAFASLEQWLRDCEVNVEELQAEVDQLLAQVRDATLAPPLAEP